jgi:Na+/H+ antiporter NhaC
MNVPRVMRSDTFALVASRYANSRRGGQLATWFIGIMTFFDDYASCLITGSTMRDITGRLRISREKLSFIVDTCAATISSLAPISSWIGTCFCVLNEESLKY